MLIRGLKSLKSQDIVYLHRRVPLYQGFFRLGKQKCCVFCVDNLLVINFCSYMTQSTEAKRF